MVMDNVKIFAAKYLLVAVILIWLYVWFRQPKDKRVRLMLATITAGIIALIISRIGSKLYYDPRPFVTQHVKPLISHPADNGFPSDHALLTSTLSAILYPFSKKWAAAAAALAVLVGIGRVTVHVHSPIDIFGAFAIGLVSAWLGWLVVSKYTARSGGVQKDAPQYKSKEQ